MRTLEDKTNKKYYENSRELNTGNGSQIHFKPKWDIGYEEGQIVASERILPPRNSWRETKATVCQTATLNRSSHTNPCTTNLKKWGQKYSTVPHTMSFTSLLVETQSWVTRTFRPQRLHFVTLPEHWFWSTNEVWPPLYSNSDLTPALSSKMRHFRSA